MNYDIFYYIPKGFYRRIAVESRKQFPVHSSREIKKRLMTRAPLYASISVFQESKAFPLYFFFDFDCEKHIAEGEIAKLQDYCKRHSYSFTVAEPKRGYHFYIHLSPTEIDANAFRCISDYIIETVGIEHYDDITDGVLNGIARLPGSYYPELNRRVRIVKQSLAKFISPFELLDGNELPTQIFHSLPDDIDLEYYRPCIDYFIQESHPSQFIRFGWAALRIAQGKSNEEMIDEARRYNWEDWDEEMTEYQINQIRSKRYKVPSCGTIRKKGYCIPQLCKWRKHKCH